MKSSVHLFQVAAIALLAVPGFALALDISAFGGKSDHSDTTPAIRAALEQCRQQKCGRLTFPTGRYDFWPDHAAERYYFISNNDEGLKRIAFPIREMENLEIDGQGSHFIFHGYVTPFVLDHSRNITIKNLSIDYARTFHSEGLVLAVGKGTADLEIPSQFPYKLESGAIVFTGEQKEDLYPVSDLLEFDPVKRETAFMARDYGTGPNVPAVAIGRNRVRISVPDLVATKGNVLVLSAQFRSIPCITVTDSAQVKLTSIDIFHCGGMAVIAQRSANLELDRVRVTPPPNSGRVVSATADATHFANCTGSIVMTHCLFENQMDDATNIHGIYAQITRRLNPDTVEVRLVHPQQHGFDFVAPGTPLELVHGPSLITYGQGQVAAVERENAEFTRVRFSAPLPTELTTGDVVADVNSHPDVIVRNCTFRGNRARGLLLGSRGKILIEDNIFHTAGAAILLEGDGRYWFEQAGVRDLTIRKNRFDDCNYGVWGKAAIEAGPGIEPSERPKSRYNRNIVIEDNLFRAFSNVPLVKGYSIDGIIIRNNRIERTTDYPNPAPSFATPYELTDSSNVRIQN